MANTERKDTHLRTCPNPLCGYVGLMGIRNTYSRTCPKCGGVHSVRRLANKIDTIRTRHVFTCAVAECGLNKPFFESLKAFCVAKDAQLHVLPLPYRNSNPTRAAKRNPVPKELAPYLQPTNLTAGDLLLVLAQVHVVATAEYPLTGLGVFGQQDLQVLGHPAVQLRPTVRSLGRDPRIAVTTGAVTRARYSDTKAGAKANFHHVDGALLVEIDTTTGYVNCRHLLADRKGGFYDLNEFWTGAGMRPAEKAAALVVGDLHSANTDLTARASTFEGPRSMRGILQPEEVVLHDVHDHQAGSHHNKWFDNVFLHAAGKDSVTKEVRETCADLTSLAPCTIVNSNHDEHLLKWLSNPLNGENPKEGAFFDTMRLALRQRAHAGHDDPATLQLAHEYFEGKNTGVRFLGLGEPFLIKNIDCSQHGHQDAKGGRGSIEKYKQYATKTITGHGHTSGIAGGAMQVGMLLTKRARYTRGQPQASCFANAVIYPNGKRALLFIKEEGRWCLEYLPAKARKKA